ncbi:TPA: Ig-like domain-containing protein [Pseudomonas aeruginosa]
MIFKKSGLLCVNLTARSQRRASLLLALPILLVVTNYAQARTCLPYAVNTYQSRQDSRWSELDNAGTFFQTPETFVPKSSFFWFDASRLTHFDLNGYRWTPGPFAARIFHGGAYRNDYQLCYEPIPPSNSPPVVSDLSLSTLEDNSGSLNLNALDPDAGDAHTFVVVTAPSSAHGSASINGSVLTFTPKPEWNGNTTLTYKAIDSKGAESNVATVTITVTPVNDPPVAQPKTLTISEDTSGAVTLTATDIDSPTPTIFQIVTAPNAAHGSASISGSTLTFTPRADWNGSTSLTYRAQDSSGAWSAPATVSITVNPVNDQPVAQAKSLIIDEDTPGTVTLSATDIDSPTPTVFQVVTAPNAAHGTASISGSTLTFTPKADWNGSTSLTYRAQDSSGAWSGPATVSITVNPVNDPPVAQAKTLITNEDTSGTVTLSATDIDSPVPTVFQIVTAPNAAHGTASISGSTLTFTPKADWNGSTSLTYRAQDSAGAWSVPAAVSITVNPVNDQPVRSGKLIIRAIEGIPTVVRGAVTK